MGQHFCWVRSQVAAAAALVAAQEHATFPGICEESNACAACRERAACCQEQRDEGLFFSFKAPSHSLYVSMQGACSHPLLKYDSWFCHLRTPFLKCNKNNYARFLVQEFFIRSRHIFKAVSYIGHDRQVTTMLQVTAAQLCRARQNCHSASQCSKRLPLSYAELQVTATQLCRARQNCQSGMHSSTELPTGSTMLQVTVV